MDKILLIVDPQVDFISGSLAVEGAKEKMDALASALQNGEIDCDYVMVTKDFHPSNHCSFKENGGQWPPHCVKGTTGCWVQPLMEKYGEDVVVKVLSRHVTSEFKRMKAPIYISRELYE